jgi:hypothetical protein
MVKESLPIGSFSQESLEDAISSFEPGSLQAV